MRTGWILLVFLACGCGSDFSGTGPAGSGGAMAVGGASASGGVEGIARAMGGAPGAGGAATGGASGAAGRVTCNTDGDCAPAERCAEWMPDGTPRCLTPCHQQATALDQTGCNDAVEHCTAVMDGRLVDNCTGKGAPRFCSGAVAKMGNCPY